MGDATLLEHHNYVNYVPGGAILPLEDRETDNECNGARTDIESDAEKWNVRDTEIEDNWDERDEDRDAE
jgi:hypothetical protein